MKTFYILNSFLSPHAFTHLLGVRRMAGGFIYKGFRLKIANSINDIKEDGFVMVSDSAFYHSLGQRNASGRYPTYLFPALVEKVDMGRQLRRLGVRFQHATEMKRLAEYSKRENKRLVLIVWGRPEDYNMFKELGMPFIMTGEYAYARPRDSRRLEWYNFWKRHKEALPIRWAADVNPANVGKGCRNTKYRVSFIGSKSYMPEYYSMFEGMKDCAIFPTPPFIDYDRCITVYKNSASSLGLQGRDIINDNMVTDRVFDALAYGAICLTNSSVAVRVTNNLAILIKDKEHLNWLVSDIRENRDSYLERRRRGFRYIKENRTYVHEADKFVGLAERLYGIDFK